MQEPADMAAAEVKVLGRLVDVDRPVLVEDPAANLVFPSTQPLQSPIDLEGPGLRSGRLFLLTIEIKQRVVGGMNGLDTASLSETLALEQHPKERYEPMALLLLSGRGQGLEGGQCRLLEQVILVGCHEDAVGVGDPVDESHVRGNPLPGLQPGRLVGGTRLIDRTGHRLSRVEHGGPSLSHGTA